MTIYAIQVSDDDVEGLDSSLDGTDRLEVPGFFVHLTVWLLPLFLGYGVDAPYRNVTQRIADLRCLQLCTLMSGRGRGKAVLNLGQGGHRRKKVVAPRHYGQPQHQRHHG